MNYQHWLCLLSRRISSLLLEYGSLLRRGMGSLPPTSGPSIATCVRRFGRKTKPRDDVYGTHITGARMSSHNGHESSQFSCSPQLTAYSGDAVYLYSTRDDPQDEDEHHGSSIIPSNQEHRTDVIPIASDESHIDVQLAETNDNEASSPLQQATADQGDLDGSDSDDLTLDAMPWDDPSVPIILPRRRFAGAGNVETVKDGPEDEFVTSGSDDGNFFIWHKATGELHGIYEGDGSVVNVIEGHPFLPLIAISGIDSTVKNTLAVAWTLYSVVVGQWICTMQRGQIWGGSFRRTFISLPPTYSLHSPFVVRSTWSAVVKVASGMMVIGGGISWAFQYSGYISNSAGDLLTPDRLTGTSSLDTTVSGGLKLCPTLRIDQRRSALIPTLSSTLAAILQLLLSFAVM
ncbi:WD40 domain containing protein [Salix suchowensis]|nr:WD40 domain containing protein [Salix suchowensis]